MTGFSDVSDDLMENIVSRMPALSFASAACVNKSWNKVCTRSLSSPKLASALSLNPSLHEAVKEVFDKVLAKPISPHFIISCIGNHFNLELAHQLITKRFGPGVPIITSSNRGIIGLDSQTNQLKSVDFGVELQDQNVGGLVLVVGFVPGLKVDAIPLFRPRMDSVETFYCSQSDVTEQALVDKFIMNIKMYNASVSDSEAPSLIILFGDDSINVKPIVARLDMEMPEETVIVGDTSSRFMCRRTSAEEGDSVVALVFARDRCRKPGVGEIEFHMALSEGIIPFGPSLETVSVVRVCFHYSSILAGIKGTEQIIHGQGLVENMHQLLDGGFHDLYIGVIEESGGESSNSTRKSTLTLYPVLGGDREYLVIKENGIKKGDTLLLYHSDSETASATSQRVDDQLLSNFLGGGYQKKKKTKKVGEKVQVFGGLVFSSYDRKQRFPGSECLDLSPFISNFPGIPVAGFFCIGEIARGPILPNFIQDDDDVDGGKGKGKGVSFNDGNGDELSSCSGRGFIQYYSTVYLAMAYLPAPPHSDDDRRPYSEHTHPPPALFFASAACVTKLWHHICTRILSRPKLASAISLKLSTDLAIEEVLDKVLSEPIRPHFAIASVSCGFGLKKTLRLLVEKLGSRTPIVLSSTIGIMGRDASSNNFKEVTFVDPDEHMDASSGIILTIGYVPGLKVEAIPLLRPTKAPQVAMVDDFVMDIRNYTLSVSGCTSPIGIILFGDRGIDQKPVIEKLDYAMSPETIIVGDERAQFLYRSGTESRSVCGSLKYFSDAVALVFAKDRSGPHARVTDIQFHAALSTGVSAIGPRYKAVSVKVNDHDRGTWLTAKREGEQEVLDGQTILDDVNDELDNRAGCPDLYIGIIK